jgi:hypothetical protein
MIYLTQRPCKEKGLPCLSARLMMASFYKFFRFSSCIRPSTITVRRSLFRAPVSRYRKFYSTYKNTMSEIQISDKSAEKKWWKEAIVYQV